MTISYIGAVGSAGSASTTATSLQVTVGTAVPAGDMLLVRFASYNYASGTISVSDSKGNSYQADYSRISSSDGINVVYSALLTTGLAVGDKVTVTFPAGNQPYAMAVDQFRGIAASGRRWQVDSTGAKGNSTAPSETVTIGANPPVYMLLIGALFVPAPSSDAFTEDTTHTAGNDTWHSMQAAFGGASPYQASRGAYKIAQPGSLPAGATFSWTPTLGAGRTWLITEIVYQGATAPVTVADRPSGTGTGSPVDTSVAQALEPVTVTSDVPAGTLTGSPLDAFGEPVTTDVPAGTPTGSPLDGPLSIGVSIPDVPVGTRVGNPDGDLAIGVVLTSDFPAGTRVGSPATAIGNTVTNDRPRGLRTGSPEGVLDGAGSTPKGPSSLSGELPNPHRPVLLMRADFTAGPPNIPAQTGSNTLNSRIRRTIVRKMSIARGRQYELDQVQAGTVTMEISDPLEYLNPDNPASPLNTGSKSLKPYRAMRVTALWPTSGNLMNETIWGAGRDPGFEGTASQWASVDSATTRAISTDVAWEGTHSLKVTQATAGFGHGTFCNPLCAPDLRMVFSAWVYPTAGTQVTIRVTDGAGNTYDSLTASTPGQWTRLWVSWRAVEIYERVEIFGTGTAPTFYVDATQLEFGAAPSEYVRTGPATYVQYTGYIERYPVKYDMHGTRGQRPLTGVDALAILSRTEIKVSYSATVLADNPVLYIPFDDQAGPQKVQLPNGGQPLVGFTQLGSNSGSVNFSGDAFLDSVPAVSVVQQNTDPATVGDTTMVTWIGTRAGSVSMNPKAFTLEMWVRHTSGVIYGGAGAMQVGETTVGKIQGTNKGVHLYTSGGQLFFRFMDPNGGDSGLQWLDNGKGYLGFPDGEWHHIVLVFDNGTYYAVVDGNKGATLTLPFTPSTAVKLDNFYMSATTYYGDPVSDVSVANWAAYSRALPLATIQAHYQRGIGYFGEASGARISRLQNTYWKGNFAIAPGFLKLAEDFGYDKRMFLDVAQEIQESERGMVYARKDGALIFDDRSSRYRGTSQVPVAVFGEDVDAGEIPYEDYEGDRDPTYTFSQANLTRPGNSDFPPMTNAQAQADYGQRILSHNVQCTNDFDLAEAGRFYLTRYSNPKTRVVKLTINPTAYPDPAAWVKLLSLEFGQRVTVKRRSPALTTSNDYYVEQINQEVDAEAGTWKFDLQLSPVFVPTAWILGDPTYGVLGSTTVPTY